MQSRTEMRKRNNRNNLYLIIIGIIVVIAIICGFIIHNQRVAAERSQREYASTHFNPNVTIYGVQVGKLTVNKATAKINKQADNVVFLRNKKIIAEKDDNVQTISQAEVKNIFTKQHTDLPSKQKYVFKSAKMDEAKKNLQKIQKAVVTYKINGKEYQLRADELIHEVTYKDGKYKFTDVKKLHAKLEKIDQEVKTLKKSYKFTVPVGNKVNGKTITVKNESYGWGIYVKKAVAAVEKALINGQTTVDGSKYIYGEGYSTYAHGYGKSNHGIGQNYVVVSIKNQELWVVRKGKVAVHLNDVVTGTEDKGNATPKGVWYIMYKESPSVLRGYNDDGSKYASKVQYWMPFTLSGCGLHDASWRNDWSKSAYLTGGSHGCVNIRPAEIRSVWNNVLTNDAVIVY
ncbi:MULTISPECIES: L,D-transpeptidase family protein [Lactobacillus]|uniref:L,D-transpeptidase family protein n=1 Tax=Lactobacillus crispatus TaxID=47770 RepID=A0AB73BNY1_9LACO|nr:MULTISPECIES: L,D-transpeptidase family protein [Lactobacillus]KAA8782014.1 L,D-transpeptidase family protein [Lactobacillus crispatus]KAA8792130.1 L,D-transpeptidase family protein [Lactobacillus crispatus]KAA8795026.1 L,D-transpeptidase family protein [Lactobacillus crispatus]KAA8797228.1 L,D-transpeptidase family protein [Lactobacillus crispatus]KAA8797489.1 L,D-transpeptidase family protein [Lactobacillus crispatus]